MDRHELMARIIQNVRGIDLNPLAVLAAKANYLIALSDLLRYRPSEGINIPVYLADSISVVRIPSKGSDEFELQTNEGRFWINEEVIQKHLLYPLLSILAESVKFGLTRDQFRTSLGKKLPLSDASIISFERLYVKILNLEKAGKNKIWASLLKNAFSPMLIGKFDYVVGNPPWINWEGLPERYRNMTRNLWKQYGLLETSQGAIKQDISMLFLVRCLDLYSADSGKLGFLMPFTIFKTKSGAGFRKVLAEEHNVVKADDLVELYPFEGAVNRTSLIIVGKGTTKFPIPCRMWMNPDHNEIGQDLELSKVVKLSRQHASILIPVEANSPKSAWMEVAENIQGVLSKAMRPSDLRAYAGIFTGADGIYLVNVRRLESDKSIVENLAITAKKEVKKVTVSIENRLLFPVVRGRDVQRWFSKPEYEMIVPHDSTTAKAIPEPDMKIDFPLAYGYLLSFKPPLARRTIKPFLGNKRNALPFYILDNMGERNFAPYKVVWKHISGKVSGKAALECAVLSHDSRERTILTTHGLMYIPLQEEDQAHFVCAILNSSIAHLIVMSYALEVHVTTDVIKYVYVPNFDRTNALHLKLSKLSKEAHELARKDHERRIQSKDMTRIESDIDSAVAELYGLTSKEQKQITDSLRILNGMDKSQPILSRRGIYA